mmetsp:Transcript_51384/g.115387  ORF Transcript_51384/g.115387 Transcript_51384/m.115387 type:complete len:156 (+) Transcript_51384:1-468(+)
MPPAGPAVADELAGDAKELEAAIDAADQDAENAESDPLPPSGTQPGPAVPSAEDQEDLQATRAPSNRSVRFWSSSVDEATRQEEQEPAAAANAGPALPGSVQAAPAKEPAASDEGSVSAGGSVDLEAEVQSVLSSAVAAARSEGGDSLAGFGLEV